MTHFELANGERTTLQEGDSLYIQREDPKEPGTFSIQVRRVIDGVERTIRWVTPDEGTQEKLFLPGFTSERTSQKFGDPDLVAYHVNRLGEQIFSALLGRSVTWKCGGAGSHGHAWSSFDIGPAPNPSHS